MGNVIRYKLLQDNRVRFAGYKKPHPLEERIEVRVQTNGDVKPEDAVKEACSKLGNELEELAANFRTEIEKFNGADLNSGAAGMVPI